MIDAEPNASPIFRGVRLPHPNRIGLRTQLGDARVTLLLKEASGIGVAQSALALRRGLGRAPGSLAAPWRRRPGDVRVVFAEIRIPDTRGGGAGLAEGFATFTPEGSLRAAGLVGARA